MHVHPTRPQNEAKRTKLQIILKLELQLKANSMDYKITGLISYYILITK